MKKTITLLALALFLLAVCHQITTRAQTEPPKPWISQNWENNDWVNSYRSVTHNNPTGAPIEDISEKWTGSEWLNEYRTTYEYNGNNQTTLMTNYSWEAGDWVESGKTHYVYDQDGRTTIYYTEYYSEGAWENSMKYTYDYDGSGYLVEEMFFMGDGSEWEEFMRTKYQNDPGGNPVIVISEMALGEDEWFESSKDTYEYDQYGRNIFRTGYDWEMMNEVWEESDKETITYNEAGLIDVVLFEWWEEGAWLYYNKSIYQYNEAGSLTEYLIQKWDEEWVNEHIYAYSYDDDNKMYYFLSRIWSGSPTDGDWENSKRGFYEGFLDMDDGAAFAGSISSHPNPAASIVNVNYELLSAGLVEITLFDQSGRKAAVLLKDYQAPGVRSLWFDSGPYETGVYFIEMRFGGNSKTLKTVFIK